MNHKIYLDAIEFLKNEIENYQPDAVILYDEFNAYLCREDSFTQIEREPYFSGCTTFTYKNELVAIIDVRLTNHDLETTSVVVHELFHVYQLSNWGDLDINIQSLVTYPYTYELELHRYYEDEYLKGSLIDISKLEDYYQMRSNRFRMLKQLYIDFENALMRFEGIAYFYEQLYLLKMGYKSLFDGECFSFNEINSENLWQNLLSKGAILAFHSHKKGEDVYKNTYTFYEANIMNGIGEVEDVEGISDMFERFKTKRQNISNQMKGFTKISFIETPQIISINPINLVYFETNYVKHKNFGLKNNEYSIMFNNEEVISEFDHIIWQTKAIYVDSSMFKEENGQLMFKNGKWDVVKKESDSHYLLK
jgi:hypothetical protein